MGYNIAIKKQLESSGVRILMLNDRPYNAVYDFFKKISISTIKLFQLLSWYFKLRNIDLSKYDVVLMIRGEHVPISVLKKLQAAGLKMIMYQWDSIQNCDYLHQVDYFSKVATFDREDSKLHGFHYFPLFFRKEYAEIKINTTKKKKALFIGTFQAKRYASVLELKERLKEVEIDTTIKIKIPYYYYYYYYKLSFKGIRLDRNYLMFKNITFKEILELYTHYDIIIDVANEHQSGLTMRTFEALGANKILLTNNEAIKQELFYKFGNIIMINAPFLQQNFKSEIQQNLVNNHRLDNWIFALLS